MVPQSQKTNSKGVALLKQFEGLRLTAYKDQNGHWTIGYGHTQDVGPGETETYNQAVQQLTDDVRATEEFINRNVEVPLTSNQFSALVCLAYNIGVGSLRDSTLWRSLNEKCYHAAADEFLRWNKVGGVPNLGLTRRRKAERELFLEG